MNTKKDEGVPVEFIFPERGGGDNRINTESVNSQTFHSNRMVNDQF